MPTSRSTYIATALLVALWLLTACGGEATPEATSAPVSAATAAQSAATAQPAAPTAAEAAAPASASLPGDPKAAILQALRNQLSAGPYRSTTTITVDGAPQTIVGAVIPPDRMQVAMDLGSIKTEMIYIGDKVWSKQGDEAWVESDRMGMPGVALLDESMIADTEKTVTEATLVGPEQVDGVDALVYTYTTDLSKSEMTPMESIMHSKVWIATATGLVIRQETTDSTAETPSTTVQVVEYDPSITIEAPAE